MFKLSDYFILYEIQFLSPDSTTISFFLCLELLSASILLTHIYFKQHKKNCYSVILLDIINKYMYMYIQKANWMSHNLWNKMKKKKLWNFMSIFSFKIKQIKQDMNNSGCRGRQVCFNRKLLKEFNFDNETIGHHISHTKCFQLSTVN
jgi:hypothetical protein